jgi:nucleotide-binding universal stress UspA family protein
MEGSMAEQARILHPTDFSSEADAAEAEAVRLAQSLNADLILLHVSVEAVLYGETAFGAGQLDQVYEAQARWAEGRLAERVKQLERRGVRASWRRRVGVPHDEIVKAAADERAAYIVIGTHGRSGIARAMLGSVADRVVRTAACPVVTVRPAPVAAAATA